MAIQTRRLSAAAIKRLRETVEAEHACGSSQIATDLDMLLKWHDEQPARDDAIRAEEREQAAVVMDSLAAEWRAKWEQLAKECFPPQTALDREATAADGAARIRARDDAIRAGAKRDGRGDAVAAIWAYMETLDNEHDREIADGAATAIASLENARAPSPAQSLAPACGHHLDEGLQCNRPRNHAGHHGWRAAWERSEETGG